MSQSSEEAILGANVWEIIDPSDRELLRQVQSRTAALRGKVEAVLRAPRIDEAAEQFIGGIVDVLRERVVRPEIQSLREPVQEIHRSGMINRGPKRRIGCQVSGETLRQQRPELFRSQEVVEVSEGARGNRNGRRNRRSA